MASVQNRRLMGRLVSEATTPLAHLSSRAQAQLDGPSPATRYPERGDLAGWQRLISDFNTQAAINLPLMAPLGQTSRRRIDAADVYISVPAGLDDAAADSTVLSFHGGGLIYLGGHLVEYLSRIEADVCNRRTWAVDYRMPPQHPYPAGVTDGLAAYRALIAECPPAKVVVYGTSAGGNIALATVLRARNAGLPMPAALLLLSPEVDLTESGDSFTTLADRDPTLSSLRRVNELYAGDHPLDHPAVSPLFDDLTALPPVFVQSGTRDLFLSNAVRLHRCLQSAGVLAELHVFEGRPHAGFGGAPEDDEVVSAMRRFLRQHLRDT